MARPKKKPPTPPTPPATVEISGSVLESALENALANALQPLYEEISTLKQQNQELQQRVEKLNKLLVSTQASWNKFCQDFPPYLNGLNTRQTQIWKRLDEWLTHFETKSTENALSPWQQRFECLVTSLNLLNQQLNQDAKQQQQLQSTQQQLVGLLQRLTKPS